MASGFCSSLDLGDDAIISKNKEMINNPAMMAPIIICDPRLPCLFPKHSNCQCFSAGFVFLLISASQTSYVSLDADGFLRDTLK